MTCCEEISLLLYYLVGADSYYFRVLVTHKNFFKIKSSFSQCGYNNVRITSVSHKKQGFG